MELARFTTDFLLGTGCDMGRVWCRLSLSNQDDFIQEMRDAKEKAVDLWVKGRSCRSLEEKPHNIAATCRWWQLKYFFYFHPENWGNDPQFDEHIFQRGWNHQPVAVLHLNSAGVFPSNRQNLKKPAGLTCHKSAGSSDKLTNLRQEVSPRACKIFLR